MGVYTGYNRGVVRRMTEKRFTSWGNKIKRNGKLLNIEFKTKTDAKLCCKLCNQMDKYQQVYIDELDELFKWYKEYYGETILDTRMGWNEDNKILKLEKENEELKEQIKELEQEIEKLDTFKKILDYAEKDSDKVDWQSYCEKEFEGL